MPGNPLSCSSVNNQKSATNCVARLFSGGFFILHGKDHPENLISAPLFLIFGSYGNDT
jgi:hypothetical protein